MTYPDDLPSTEGWRPAQQAPELLGTPVADALESGAIDVTKLHVVPIDAALADTNEFCRHYGWPLDRSANCVIVKARRGDTSKTAACVVLATDRVDVNKRVRNILGVRKASFADLTEVVETTGMEYGGIGPIGLPTGWPVLVDKSVISCPWVILGSGIRGSKLAIPGELVPSIPGVELHEIAL